MLIFAFQQKSRSTLAAAKEAFMAVYDFSNSAPPRDIGLTKGILHHFVNHLTVPGTVHLFT
jgi:hypothetical protein